MMMVMPTSWFVDGTVRALLMRIVAHVLLSIHSRREPDGELFVPIQTTTAAGRHIVSNPIRSSKRYEPTGTSATSLNQARYGVQLAAVTSYMAGGRLPPAYWL
jgi:hypothetical protein